MRRTCSDYQRRRSYRAYAEEFSHIGRPFEISLNRTRLPTLNLRSKSFQPISRRSPRPREDGVEFVTARWGFGRLATQGSLKAFRLATFNARAETVPTSGTFRDAFAQRSWLVAGRRLV